MLYYLVSSTIFHIMPTYAKVTAYKGFLVAELQVTKSTENEVTTSLDTSSMGQVIHDSLNVEMSEAALALIKTIKRGSDSIGDIDCWECNDGKYAFAWFGGPNAIFKPDVITTSRQFALGEFNMVENEAPDGAKAAIDAS